MANAEEATGCAGIHAGVLELGKSHVVRTVDSAQTSMPKLHMPVDRALNHTRACVQIGPVRCFTVDVEKLLRVPEGQP